jgi:outer membrane lipoprotein SlyB
VSFVILLLPASYISSATKVKMNQIMLTRHQIVLILLFFSVSVTPFALVESVSRSAPLAESSTTQLSAERRPWNIVRFVQQSSRFVSPFPRTVTKKTLEKGVTIWKAGASTNEFTFAPLDDVVMGGASSSTFDGATGKWTGEVTDANNGGFIGIRSTPFVEYDMSKCAGIQLRISPGNREALRLKVVLRDSTDFNGIGWTTSVNIEAKGSTITIPFNKQVPTRFAQTVLGPTFGKDQVRGIQFVFSKFEYDGALNPKFRSGDFSVQVEEVKTY